MNNPVDLSQRYFQKEEEILLSGSFLSKIKKLSRQKNKGEKEKELQDPTKFYLEIDPHNPAKFKTRHLRVRGKDNLEYRISHIEAKYPHLLRYLVDHGFAEMLRVFIASMLQHSNLRKFCTGYVLNLQYLMGTYLFSIGHIKNKYLI